MLPSCVYMKLSFQNGNERFIIQLLCVMMDLISTDWDMFKNRTYESVLVLGFNVLILEPDLNAFTIWILDLFNSQVAYIATHKTMIFIQKVGVILI